MPKKRKIKLSDDLIRDALEHDLESVNPPPSEKMWQRIEGSLETGRTSAVKRRFAPGRFAAVAAAACLLLVLGSIGIFRFTELAMPAREVEMPIRTADEAVPAEVEEKDVPEVTVPEELEVDPGIEPAVREEVEPELDIAMEEKDEPEIEVAMEEEAEPEADDPAKDEMALMEAPSLYGERDPSPPEWQSELPGNFTFHEALLMYADEEQFYRAAVYSNEEAELLWVKSDLEDEKLGYFIDQLVEQLNEHVRELKEVDETVHFTAADRPGLAWREENHNQALLVVSGHLSAERLKDIAAGIE